MDYRPPPLGERKERLARLVDRRLSGIVMNDHTDTGGELVFEQACRMGLEGHRVQASVEAVSIRPIGTLAQDQEPRQPGDGAASGRRNVTGSSIPDSELAGGTRITSGR